MTLPVRGAGHYVDGGSAVWFSLLGLHIVATVAGEATSKSGLGRSAGEAVRCPSALLLMRAVTREQHSRDMSRVLVPAGGRTTRLDLTLNADGAVREVIVDRFDNGRRPPDREHVPFGGVVEQEQTFDGHTIHTRAHGGRLAGEAGYEERVRFEVTPAHFL